MIEFKECEICAAKPESPLCASCLHNRATIGELVGRVQRLEEEATALHQVCDLIRERRVKDYGWLILGGLVLFAIGFGVYVYLTKK
jgi:hypothetical protein